MARRSLSIPAPTNDIPINSRRVLIALKNAVEALQATGGGGSSTVITTVGGGSSTGVTSHSSLGGLQGGNAAEQYHLTSTQHSALTGNGTTTLHRHDEDRARSNHTGTQGWSTVSKEGASLNDIPQRSHNLLANLAGSQDGYHLSQAHHASLTSGTKPNYVTGTWAPTFTSLTEVLGAGAVAYTGRYQKVGRVVTYLVSVTPSGGATTAATAGTTFFDLPFPAAVADTCIAGDMAAMTGLGTGVLDATTDQVYPPGWTASTAEIVISGRYEAE